MFEVETKSESEYNIFFIKYTFVVILTVTVWVGLWTFIVDLYHYYKLDNSNIYKGLLLILIGLLGLYFLFVVFKFSNNLSITPL
jgi:hypothetical protein